MKLELSADVKFSACKIKVGAGQHGVCLLSDSSSPPLRADRVSVGVAAGVTKLISPLLAGVRPPR